MSLLRRRSRGGDRRSGRLLAAGAALLVLAGCTSDPEPAPPPPPATATAPAPGPAPAQGATPFGAHWDWNRYEQFTPYLRKISGSATYHELSWCDIEPERGSTDWSAVDRVAERSRALGITLHLKIRTGVCWATGGTAQHVRGQAGKTESAMPRDLATYKSFVDSVVRRYAPFGVREYAVENEVNAPQYWAGSPADYATLVGAAAEAIRAADPRAKVVDSGISSVAYGWGVADRLLRAGQEAEAVRAYNAYFQRRIGTRGKQIPAVSTPADLRAALTVPQNARNLEYLAATEKLLDDKVVDVRQVHFYEHWSAVPDLLGYLAAETPAGTPVSAWEVGQFWRDGDADAASRSAEMVKAVTQLAAGGLREVIWLPLAYNPDNRQGSEVRYGLLDPDGKERTAGQMLAGLAALAQGATAEPVSGKGLTGAAFRRGAETALVVWASAGPVTVPDTAGLTSGTVGGAPSASGAVEVTADPVVLKAQRPPADIMSGIRQGG
ncbi:hypothetical protein [Phytohabitans suffuscus]|uniref:Glycoside hydrolase family 42 N-terminal domain-containing protein n=1 Tax=Phytohabitans suffuscus TaxID=624315 RepID=A0A6F8YXC5_9ACTN|nr:hypothetical protein [Phytohabitans suffuscus]BCB90820.1 hypothetical protein Psuf_081330 [Phytohabitans suffuscus]